MFDHSSRTLLPSFNACPRFDYGGEQMPIRDRKAQDDGLETPWEHGDYRRLVGGARTARLVWLLGPSGDLHGPQGDGRHAGRRSVGLGAAVHR